MSGRLQIVLIICSFLFLGATISYIRRKGLDLYHSIIWFLGAAILLLMAFFPGFVEWISGVFGVETTSNFVFLILIGFLMISCLSMSAAISRHHTRIKKQVQSLAILENRLEIVEAELSQLKAAEEASEQAEASFSNENTQTDTEVRHTCG